MNQFGFEKEATQKIGGQLNQLLANYQVYYQNLRGLHWNIKGNNFFELHEKFEELYLDSQDKIDLLAERVLILGEVPLHRFEDYLKKSKIKSLHNEVKDKKAVKAIVANILVLIKIEREALKVAQDFDDEGTAAMLSDFIVEHEKLIWMFNAWLG